MFTAAEPATVSAAPSSSAHALSGGATVSLAMRRGGVAVDRQGWEEPVIEGLAGRWTSNMLARVSVRFHPQGMSWIPVKYLPMWLPWEQLSTVTIGDGSRYTVTRLATLGVAGVGFKKSQTHMTVVRLATEEDYTYRRDRPPSITELFTLWAPEPQVAGVLRHVAATVPSSRAVLSQFDVADVQPVGGRERGLTEQLSELGHLYEKGVLTDEEFAAAKQRLLNS